MNNCTRSWNDSDGSVEITGMQDAAEWLGLRTLSEGTGLDGDSLPYYIGVGFKHGLETVHMH